MKCRQRQRLSFLALSQSLLHHPLSSATATPQEHQHCDPCATAGEDLTFKVKPGTACQAYVQCFNGKNMGDFNCNGDTIFDENKQFCDWSMNSDCVEASCPPTPEPSTGQPTIPIASCPNPCPIGYTGFTTRPSSACKQYVSCKNGQVVEELECFGDTIFNESEGYCDWPSSYACDVEICPEREPTVSPTAMKIPDSPDSGSFIDESADCPNPCPVGFDGFRTRPGTQCKNYVSCVSGEATEEKECFGDTIFNPNVQYCDWASTHRCRATECPEREPTVSPTPLPSMGKSPGKSPIPVVSITVPVSEPITAEDCPNPCPWNYSGLQTKPGTECQKFAECESGVVVEEFTCSGDSYFVEVAGNCMSIGVLGDGWTCPRVPCPTLPPTDFPTEKPAIIADKPPSVVETARPTKQPTQQPTRQQTMLPTPRPSFWPTTAKPTPTPVPTYQHFRTILIEREDTIKSIVLQSNGKPSSAYTFSDLISSLDIAVFQFPADKAFFVGDGMSGGLSKLSDVEYGLVNLGLFLSHAMQEGIWIDSCDEWNTDFLYDDSREYPLSNACGQYGRSYQDEECPENQPLHCAIDKTLEITAIHGNVDVGAPPFTCRPRTYNGLNEIFPGYYDAVDGVVIQSAYSNTLGRTDVESCCYWGRGVLLTRGRCIIGKLDQYIGKGAVDRGVNVYPDIDFCANPEGPEVICSHPRTNELRWVIGILEWTDRVQSYADSYSGWKYLDQLIKFVDGDMVDDEFINTVTNIVTRKCHGDSCDDQWKLDEYNNVFEASRRDNFRKIFVEVFNLPLTYHPTVSPSLSPTRTPTFSPLATQRPSAHPTHEPSTSEQPTERDLVVNVEVGTQNDTDSSSAHCWKACEQLALFITALSMFFFCR